MMRHPLQHDDDINEDDEQIFELQQENIELRRQITYLQEQLYQAEDELDKVSEGFKGTIEKLEQQLGDALYGKN
jgi:predicted  nucleic acid-binding Zn-ribbon protein